LKNAMRPTVNHWADLQHNAVPSAGANVNNNTPLIFQQQRQQ